MRTVQLMLCSAALCTLAACGLKPPNPDLEAERMAVEACSQQIPGISYGSRYVNFDVCMEQYGYTREQRKTIW